MEQPCLAHHLIVWVGTEANEKAEATGINQSDPTCTSGTSMTEPSINSGTGTNNNLGKNKLDKLNISESVRGIKNKKKEGVKLQS